MSRILKYNEAKLKIVRLIGERNLKPGDRIPTERELAALLGVSIISIRRAVQELQDAGIIQRKQGVGSFFTGNVVRNEYRSILGVVSISDPRFPSGEDMYALRRGLQRHHADYRLFNVNEDVDMSIAQGIAECDRFIVSGFVNKPWLDYLFSQGKPLVQIGVSEHGREVCQVKFDWETAIRETIARLKSRGAAEIGLLLINPNSASCSYERARIFEKVLRENGLPFYDSRVCFVVPERALAHLRDYMCSQGPALETILVDYHVFNLLTFSRIQYGFPMEQNLVVLQTVRELRDEVNQLDKIGVVYFPDTILDSALEVLYKYPYSFIERKETFLIAPCLAGKVLESPHQA